MIVRGWMLVLLPTLVALLTSTWGVAAVVYLLSWWAVYVCFGGLRHGIRIRRPFRGYGEESASRSGEARRT